MGQHHRNTGRVRDVRGQPVAGVRHDTRPVGGGRDPWRRRCSLRLRSAFLARWIGIFSKSTIPSRTGTSVRSGHCRATMIRSLPQHSGPEHHLRGTSRDALVMRRSSRGFNSVPELPAAHIVEVDCVARWGIAA
jgi:hypothetical protein